MAGRRIFLKVRRISELAAVIFFIVLIYTFYSSWRAELDYGLSIAKQSYSRGRPDLPKYVHLDLKGAPPNAETFYEPFFSLLENLQMGVKGVVIEYEDTLPLKGSLMNAVNGYGYSKSEIELIVQSAKKHQLELIPLIQTFGHLEWILKLKEYQHYRDDPDLPTVISPCFNDTYTLLEDLLKQTLDFHPDSKIIHIGCDEVSLNLFHKQCRQLQTQNTYEIYINHIQRVVSIVRKIRPGIRVLIWDDILRHIGNERLLASLKDFIEPVSWNYFTEFSPVYTEATAWQIYKKFFPIHWAASAFKGGLHRHSMVTNTSHHVLNNRQWLNFIDSSNFRENPFHGIILTGWSRFDHFMPLCDLLPTAYPSLLLSLHVLNTNEFVYSNENYVCERLLTVIGKESTSCESIPGSEIWSTLLSFSSAFPNMRKRFRIVDTVAPEYNRKASFVRRYELRTFLGNLKAAQAEFLSYKNRLAKQMTSLYTSDIINEWFQLYFLPFEQEIEKVFNETQPSLNRTIWPKRPLIPPN